MLCLGLSSGALSESFVECGVRESVGFEVIMVIGMAMPFSGSTGVWTSISIPTSS